MPRRRDPSSEPDDVDFRFEDVCQELHQLPRRAPRTRRAPGRQRRALPQVSYPSEIQYDRSKTSAPQPSPSVTTLEDKIKTLTALLYKPAETINSPANGLTREQKTKINENFEALKSQLNAKTPATAPADPSLNEFNFVFLA